MRPPRSEDDAGLPAQRPSPPVVPDWADTLTRVLDELVTVPGTRIRLGLDAVLGLLLPGVGDLLTGTGSLALLVLALKSGVPRVVLLRMLVNLAIDAIVGAIPVLGDVFDVAWRANRKNLDLLRRHLPASGSAAPRRASAGDYAVVALAAVVVAAAVVLPIAAIVLVLRWLGS